jgi:type I restriction enzyme S subunit
MTNGQLIIDNGSLTVGEASARYQSAIVNSPLVPSGYKQTEAGVIPEDWDVKNLGSLAQVMGGGAFKSQNATRTGIRWLKIANVGINQIIWNEESFLPKEFELSNRDFLLKEGDYVLALTRPILSGLLKISRIQKQNAPALLNQRAGKLESLEGNDLDFLYFLFQKESTVFAMQQSMAGTDPPNLSTKGIYSIPCVIPKKKAEQRAIAAALSDVDALLAKLDQLIAKKRDLKQAAMQQLLTGQTRLPEFIENSKYKKTEVGLIPEDWNVWTIGASLHRGRLGGNYPNQETESSRPLIKMGNIARGCIDITKIEYVPEYVKIEPEHRLKSGDILFNTRNTLDLVGKVSIWRGELPEAYYNSNLMRLEFNPDVISSNAYANYALNTGSSIDRLRAIATGTTSVAAIYTRDLMQFLLPIPPKSEQTAIATILSDMDAEIAVLEVRRDKTKDLKQGMMQELLTGRIRLV